MILCSPIPSVTQFAASASALGRDPAIVSRDIASAAPFNRGLAGSALRVNPGATGADVASFVPRPSRDDGSVIVPQSRVDHLVARLGAGLVGGPAASAGIPQTSFARSFLSPGSAGRTPSASNRPNEDALSSSIAASGGGQDSLYLVESLSQPGLFTCHRSLCVPLT